MISLKSISKYIEQTANIIAGVLGLDVLIVDSDLLILGDSDLESISENTCINKTSILAEVIYQKKVLILDSKLNRFGCVNCEKKPTCPVTGIIGIPLYYNDKIIGSIGIIANSIEDKENIIKNEEKYMKFIYRTSDLITNRLQKEEEINEISILNKKMEVVLDSINDFLILVSNTGKILNTNFEFNKTFNFNTPENIYEILENDLANKILIEKEMVKYAEVKINKNNEFLLSSKPVIIDAESQGAVLILKSLKDYTTEINDLYNYDININFNDLIGNSNSIKKIKTKIKKIASSSSTVLITGETGTGKEVVARLIHNNSKRKDQPFIAINCSAIPDNLLESELFGYEEGAFSGAKKGGKIGKLHLAEGGTLFLDEIGEMPIHLQSKILRVLEERKITRIGGLKSSNIDIRVISATNKNLEFLVKEGKFREDLFYRLKVIPFKIPPLRERKNDIELLIRHFIEIYSKKLNKNIIDISEEARKVLLRNQWPGNIRELKNVIEFAINMAESNIITKDNLPSDINRILFETSSELNIDNIVKELIIESFNKYGTTTKGKENAANALGISVATLYRKVIKFKLDKNF